MGLYHSPALPLSTVSCNRWRSHRKPTAGQNAEDNRPQGCPAPVASTTQLLYLENLSGNIVESGQTFRARKNIVETVRVRGAASLPCGHLLKRPEKLHPWLPNKTWTRKDKPINMPKWNGCLTGFHPKTKNRGQLRDAESWRESLSQRTVP